MTPIARESLADIRDGRIRKKISERIDGLAHYAYLQGKPLSEDLAGCWSVRAAGQRYRIIYQIKPEKIVILLVGIRKQGSKKDVYALAQKLIRQGFLSL